MQLHLEAVSELRFIPPCSPIRAKEVPAGEDWLHEVKFDGYRVQAHKAGSRIVIYSRNGHDFTERFTSIAQLLHELPAKATVLDGEVVASDVDGRPNFARLHVRWTRPGTIHLWAFYLLAFNVRDLRPQSLAKRKARLQALLERFNCPAVSLSEPFEDGQALLRVAEERGLEGIVSKRRDAPYRRRVPGLAQGQDVAWRGANRVRWRLFEVR
jgi:bifunctional non-homologous end joining protein LigD